MGDPARARAWLADIWSPAVMVVASPETDVACLASTGLTVVELLRPFGVIPHLNGTVGGERGNRLIPSPGTNSQGLPWGKKKEYWLLDGSSPSQPGW